MAPSTNYYVDNFDMKPSLWTCMLCCVLTVTQAIYTHIHTY